MKSNLIESIKSHEGWESKPYPDPIHGWDVPTFGYGFTYLTEQEGEMVLRNRVKSIIEQLGVEKPVFKALTEQRQNSLIEMAYQLGVGGLLNFKKMWAAIEQGNFDLAREEALNSKWAKQTPARASSVSKGLL